MKPINFSYSLQCPRFPSVKRTACQLTAVQAECGAVIHVPLCSFKQIHCGGVSVSQYLTLWDLFDKGSYYQSNQRPLAVHWFAALSQTR